MGKKPKRKGPTPSRAVRERRRRDLELARPGATELVVRVFCDGPCKQVMFNPHASGDDKNGEPMYVVRCPTCGSVTSSFHDLAPAPVGAFEPAA